MRLTTGLLAMLALAAAAPADEITIGKLAYAEVKITEVRDGQITFLVLASGGEVRKPLTEVTTVKLSGDKPFNDAEKALAHGQAQEAVKAFKALLTDATDGWRKELIEARLATAQDLVAKGATTQPSPAPPPPSSSPRPGPASRPVSTATAPAPKPEEQTQAALDSLTANLLHKGNIVKVSVSDPKDADKMTEDLGSYKQDLEEFAADPTDKPLAALAARMAKWKALPKYVDFLLVSRTLGINELKKQFPKVDLQYKGALLCPSYRPGDYVVQWVSYGHVAFSFHERGSYLSELGGVRIECQRFLRTHRPPPGKGGR